MNERIDSPVVVAADPLMMPVAHRLALASLALAAAGKMPPSVWFSDPRIELACATLRWDPEDALRWAARNPNWSAT